jgi:hypothetical protein
LKNKKPGNRLNILTRAFELGFGERLDAFGAVGFADENPAFLYPYTLQIRLKLVPGRAHRVAAAVAEHWPFATLFTFRHDRLECLL